MILLEGQFFKALKINIITKKCNVKIKRKDIETFSKVKIISAKKSYVQGYLWK